MSSIRAVLAAAAILAATPALAQQAKTVDGVVINIGIVSAIMAEHVDPQHGVHKGGHGSGNEHIVVVLAEEKGGVRIADAEVTVEVRNPKGVVQRKPLTAMTTTAGFPDYSEVFEFAWSGRYDVRVLVVRKGKTRPLKADFRVNHVL
jgi:hypothetical protein